MLTSLRLFTVHKDKRKTRAGIILAMLVGVGQPFLEDRQLSALAFDGEGSSGTSACWDTLVDTLNKGATVPSVPVCSETSNLLNDRRGRLTEVSSFSVILLREKTGIVMPGSYSKAGNMGSLPGTWSLGLAAVLDPAMVRLQCRLCVTAAVLSITQEKMTPAPLLQLEGKCRCYRPVAGVFRGGMGTGRHSAQPGITGASTTSLLVTSGILNCCQVNPRSKRNLPAFLIENGV